MDLNFLDANILFPAAYHPDTGLRRLWSLSGVRKITSAYMAEEDRRHLSRPKQREGLEELLSSVEVVATAASTDYSLFSSIGLPVKDQSVVLAAIGAGARHPLTGDFQHFGRYYRERI